MNKKIFTSLMLATIALILIALMSSALKKVPSTSASTSAELLPDFKATQSSVTKVVLKEAGSEPLAIQLHEGQWVLSSKSNYPVNAAVVRNLFESLSKASKREAKTKDPLRYQQLAVHDETKTLQIYTGEVLVTEVLLGHDVTRPEGQFVRIKGEPQSWLIDRRIALPDAAGAWLHFALPNMSSADVKSVERIEFTGVQCVMAPCPEAERTLFSLSKTDATQTSFNLAPLPAKKEMAAAYKIAGITEVMNGLSVSNVSRRSELATNADKKQAPVRTRFTRFDGLQVDTQLWHIADKYWLSFDVGASEEATDEIKAEAKKFADSLNEWSYEIASYKGEGLARGIHDLVQDKATSAP